MTTILGVNTNDHIYIYSDSHYMSHRSLSSTTPKVNATNEIIWGCAGAVEHMNQITEYLIDSTPPKNYNDMITILKDIMSIYGESDGGTIIGFKVHTGDKIARYMFEVDNSCYLQVNISAIGTGGDYALSAMYALLGIDNDSLSLPGESEFNYIHSIRRGIQISISLDPNSNGTPYGHML